MSLTLPTACVFLTRLVASYMGLAADAEPEPAVVQVSAFRCVADPYHPWLPCKPRPVAGQGLLLEDGRVLTVAHVVAGASGTSVLTRDAGQFEAEVECVDYSCDLALLRLKAKGDKASPRGTVLQPAVPRMGDIATIHSDQGEHPVQGKIVGVGCGWRGRSTHLLSVRVAAAPQGGDSGCPALVGNRLLGLANMKAGDKGDECYLVPAEVIQHFMTECRSAAGYQGFPILDINLATIENEALRAYLKMPVSMGGTVVTNVRSAELRSHLKPWDVIVKSEGHSIDATGMVTLADGNRVFWLWTVARLPGKALAHLSVWRKSRLIELQVPTQLRPSSRVRREPESRISYFVYGGLVFSPATYTLEPGLTDAWVRSLAWKGSDLFSQWRAASESPDDELVITCCPQLSHAVNKGYLVSAFSVVRRVNDVPVKNLRHLARCIRDASGEYVVLEFDGFDSERVVFRKDAAAAAKQEILKENKIPSPCSPDLTDVCP